MIQEQYLTFSEVQQRLGISRTTIWRWINERGLKVIKIGERVTRIRESDLATFLKQHEVTTPEQ